MVILVSAPFGYSIIYTVDYGLWISSKWLSSYYYSKNGLLNTLLRQKVSYDDNNNNIPEENKLRLRKRNLLMHLELLSIEMSLWKFILWALILIIMMVILLL